VEINSHFHELGASNFSCSDADWKINEVTTTAGHFMAPGAWLGDDL
jgi:hypothetical protein